MIQASVDPAMAGEDWMMGKPAVLALTALLAALFFGACSKVDVYQGVDTATLATKVFKIGLAFNVGGLGDLSFNDSAYVGLKLLAETYKGFIVDESGPSEGTKVQLRYLESRMGGMDYEQMLRFYAEEKYDLIIAIGYSFTDSVLKVARNYPATNFALVDGMIPNLDAQSNITCVQFAENQGAFLVGAMAGLMTRNDPSKRVGFIGGMDNPQMEKIRIGFYAGASFANPGLVPKGILTRYVGTALDGFNNSSQAKDLALKMYDQGISIIFHSSGRSGSGVFEAAAAKGKLAIGSDIDQGFIYSSSGDPELKKMGGSIVSSMIKRLDQAIFLLGKELIERSPVQGKVFGGYKLYRLEDGGISYAMNTFNEDRLQPIKAELERIKGQILVKSIIIPENNESLYKFVDGFSTALRGGSWATQ